MTTLYIKLILGLGSLQLLHFSLNTGCKCQPVLELSTLGGESLMSQELAARLDLNGYFDTSVKGEGQFGLSLYYKKNAFTELLFLNSLCHVVLKLHTKNNL